MQINLFARYLELFVKLYNEGNIEVSWRSNPPKFRSSIEIEDAIREMNFDGNERDFVRAAFTIIDISKALATNNVESLQIEQAKIDLVANVFINNKSVKQDIAVKCLTNAKFLDDVRYEILTKRSKQNPLDILGYSLQLHLDINDSMDNRSRVLIELSRQEVGQLIDMLRKAMNEMEILRNKENRE